MSTIVFLLLITLSWGARPRVPLPKTPDEIHQNDQDLIDQIEDLGERTSGVPADLTIASGVINITRHFHTVDTQGAGATDDLDIINGGNVGDMVVMQAKDSARTVVVKDGAGLKLAGDFSLDNVEDKILLIRISTSEWHEVSRSDNG